MSQIAFLLNGAPVRLSGVSPSETLLDWLRDSRGLTGTKEGCNEGDCGACTVMVTDRDGARAMNACILMLPQIHGKAVRTVEGVSGPDGEPHPVQEAMVACHGSQCGYCTPGFVVSMAAAHLNGRRDFDDQLAGNLCRCTGYAPIVRAAQAAADEPVPEWMREDLGRLPATDDIDAPDSDCVWPRSADELDEWFARNPDGTIVGGATDLGVQVAKEFREISPAAFLSGTEDLREIRIDAKRVRVGAAATMTSLGEAMAGLHPGYAEMIRRYGSVQVRNAATVGGNIANGSPVGDNPPALIALGATLHLRGGGARRELPLEDFFLDYGRQDRGPGEFVEAVSFPRQPDRLRVYKLSKRFDQDISATCGAFSVEVEGGRVARARIAFGGMAAVPKRALAVEKALAGRPWNEDSIEAVRDAWEEDFQPISDMRASAGYRLEAARNMLVRYCLEDRGVATRVREIVA